MLVQLASRQRFLATRAQLVGAGFDDEFMQYQVARGRWERIHDGVYQIDRRPLDWEARVSAAVLAAGDTAVASHRAAFMLWGLDGLSSAPVEITMPFGRLPDPTGAIVHRTRRVQDTTTVRQIPVTIVERTLLDCASCLPRIVVAKALDSAIRRGLTTVDLVYDLLVARGGRGVRGTKSLRWILRERLHDTATGSGSEFELLYHMQIAFLPRPELQHPLFTANGKRAPDFYWPRLNKAVEVDGVDAHSSADRLDDDLRRQNDLMDLGIELRRFSARRVRRDPKEVVAEIRQFLEG